MVSRAVLIAGNRHSLGRRQLAHSDAGLIVRNWFRLRPLVVDGVVVACMHGGSNASWGSQEATEHRARVDRALPARMRRE